MNRRLFVVILALLVVAKPTYASDDDDDSEWQLQATNVCFDSKARIPANTFQSLVTGPVGGVQLRFRSGGVACGTDPSIFPLSPFSCVRHDGAPLDKRKVFVSQAGDSSPDKLWPAASVPIEGNGRWYSVAGNNYTDPILTLLGQVDVTKGEAFSVLYGEVWANSASISDNRGSTCLDVYFSVPRTVWQLQATNVCFDSKARIPANTFQSLVTGPVGGVQLRFRSGGVSCSANPSNWPLSPFSCVAISHSGAPLDKRKVFVSQAGDSSPDKLWPAASVPIEGNGWYSVAGNSYTDPILTLLGQVDVTKGEALSVLYGEVWTNSASISDNRGSTCLDVYFAVPRTVLSVALPPAILDAKCSALGAPAPAAGGAASWDPVLQEIAFTWTRAPHTGPDSGMTCQPVTCDLYFEHTQARLAGSFFQQHLIGQLSAHPDDNVEISAWNEILLNTTNPFEGYVAIGTPTQFITRGSDFGDLDSLGDGQVFEFETVLSPPSNVLRISTCQNDINENFRISIKELSGDAFLSADALEVQVAARAEADRKCFGDICVPRETVYEAFGPFVYNNDNVSSVLCNPGDAMLNCQVDVKDPTTVLTDGAGFDIDKTNTWYWVEPAAFVPWGSGTCVHTETGYHDGPVLSTTTTVTGLDVAQCQAQCASTGVQCGSVTFLTATNGVDTECRMFVTPSAQLVVQSKQRPVILGPVPSGFLSSMCFARELAPVLLPGFAEACSAVSHISELRARATCSTAFPAHAIKVVGSLSSSRRINPGSRSQGGDRWGQNNMVGCPAGMHILSCAERSPWAEAHQNQWQGIIDYTTNKCTTGYGTQGYGRITATCLDSQNLLINSESQTPALRFFWAPEPAPPASRQTYVDFQISPALPSGLDMDTQTGIVWQNGTLSGASLSAVYSTYFTLTTTTATNVTVARPLSFPKTSDCSVSPTVLSRWCSVRKF